ncbi:Pathoproteinsis-related protein 5 [Hibiscus syriacus]|uniref:Pathoproteinsis-related protein 5 n=1 Tax=Hibiscus syriacus TaxID=106335 RepID=A0A6A3CRF9_HIBSY|nr:pathogenesis-related thaumatin-like protein 3.5 [Hibiscus syriacus]KAE8729758.1 Pathoproteinsis-related protein 5 [Hibiscus syriacus]
MDLLSPLLFTLLLLSSGIQLYECARTFNIINNCKETIWPGIIPGESFNGGGIELKPHQSVVFNAPAGWSLRSSIWDRSSCKFDSNGNGPCQTRDCGETLKCGAAGKTPASLAEFTLATLDFYDVSLVDGFNVPVSVTPLNGKGNCSTVECNSDLRRNCPSELAVKANGKVIACRSACDVFNTDEYCCRGTHGNPSTCQPMYYSKTFKSACPTSYSYAYDDPTSIFTCSGADYVITFCSTRNQAVYSYHDHKLVCKNKANGLNPLVGRWWAALLLLLFITNLGSIL